MGCCSLQGSEENRPLSRKAMKEMNGPITAMNANGKVLTPLIKDRMSDEDDHWAFN